MTAAYTPTALRHIDSLIDYYVEKQRPEAIRNLEAALTRVEAAIGRAGHRARDFPSTYRNLARPGRAWIKEAIYWVAYETSDPPVIVAVFWERADLARRYAEVS